eukprot:TRINITY_DN3520_c3_g1_i1.p1 TRINITY_DN3520_c3_g1~~TRINITY_DN3520_c3_g1_i1.p1  ORF type:complete len:418 (+),score=28.70 TRINITY_DN3520_c3_g1_i1:102-1256(+)
MEIFLDSGCQQEPIEITEKSTIEEVKVKAKALFQIGDTDVDLVVEGIRRTDHEIISDMGVQNGDLIKVKQGRSAPRRMRGRIKTEGTIRSMAVSETLLLVTGTSSGNISIYDANWCNPQLLASESTTTPITSIEFSPCGTAFVVTLGDTFQIWDSKTVSKTYSSPPSASRLTCITVTEQNVYYCTERCTSVCNLRGGPECVFSFGGTCSRVSRQGDLVAVSTLCKKVYLLDGSCVIGGFSSNGVVKQMCFLKESLVVLTSDAVKVFSLKHNIVVQRLNPYPYSSLIAGSACHDTVVITKGRGVYITDQVLDTQVTRCSPHIIKSLCVPAYGDYFVAGSVGHTYAYDLQSGRELCCLECEASLAVSNASGSLLVTAAKNIAIVWF